MSPYGSYVARTTLWHTLAFNEALKGVTLDHLRYALLSPGTDVSFIDDAVRRFVQTSAYLDDRPNVPLRFLTEANLTQVIRRQEQQVDPQEVRAQLNDRIKSIFAGAVFTLVPFPGGPYDVPDEATEGKPSLVLLGYDAADIAGEAVVVPELVGRIYHHRGTSGELRLNRNHVVFLCVDAARKEEMRHKMVWRLALDALRAPERLGELAAHQQDRVLEWYRRSEQEVAIAIQQAYRHVFYPSRLRLTRMRQTPFGWGEDDFRRLYRAYGFDVIEGRRHIVVRHPDYPDLVTTVARHRELPPAYARTALRLIGELLRRTTSQGAQEENTP